MSRKLAICALLKNLYERCSVRKIVMSGVVALAAVLGGAIPAATASAAVRPTAAAAAALPATVRPLASIESAAFFLGSRISCGSATACLAVGANVTNSSETSLAEALSGTKWKSVSVKLPKGADSAGLTGVSCKAATYCLVIGEYSTSAGAQLAFALTWNGSVLTPVAAPPVPAGGLLTLNAISCVAVKSCVAVGTSVTNSGTDTFTDTWNGSKWTEVKAVTKGIMLDEFSAMHCFSSKDCVAAGVAYSETGATTVLVATWNGKTWTPEKAVTPAGQMIIVGDLSCGSAKSCALVGMSMNNAATSAFGFLEVWNGKTWSETKWTGAKGDTLTFTIGVSCTSAANCMAVGAAGTSKSGAAAALSWNGKKWTALTVPGPAKGDSSDFEGVSCPKAGDCVAIGQAGKTNTTNTSQLAGSWNGKSWKLAAA
jgi:hypothetical protein